MTPFEVSYEATPDFVASQYWALLRRDQGGYMISAALIAGLSVWAILSRSEPVFWAFWLGVAMTFWIGWWQGARRSRAVRKALASPTISLAVDEKGCTFRRSNIMTWLAWSEIGRIDRLKGGLVLRLRTGGGPTPIPLAALSPEQQSEIVSAARAAGARVR